MNFIRCKNRETIDRLVAAAAKLLCLHILLVSFFRSFCMQHVCSSFLLSTQGGDQLLGNSFIDNKKNSYHSLGLRSDSKIHLSASIFGVVCMSTQN